MPVSTEKIVINGNDLTVEQVHAVASLSAPVEIAQSAMGRVKKGRQIVDDITNSDMEVYGITTGTGANKDVRIPQELVTEFQNRILISHCIGIKPYYSEEIVRAIMLCRANTMAKGATGVQPQIVEMFVDMLNAGIHPLTPMRGSVGLSDLGPMSELSLPLIGLGEVIYKDKKMPSAKALEMAGLTPLKLAAKDGISLCNNNGLTMGHGTVIINMCQQLLDTADISYALLLEGYRGNVTPLHPGVGKVRPHIGQEIVLTRVRNLLEGSFLWDSGIQRSCQDPVSLRSAIQVNGACRDALRFAKEGIEIEINSSGDNPLVLIEENDMISNGNYHIATVVMRFEMLGIALASLANMIGNRLTRIMTPEFANLPRFLTPDPGTSCGFSTMQKTFASLYAEIRHLANPAMLDALQVANLVEDHATMGPYVLQKTEKIIGSMHYIIGMEMFVAAQAIDLIGKPKLGKGTELAYETIRSVVPALKEDRLLNANIENAAKLIESGRVLQECNI